MNARPRGVSVSVSLPRLVVDHLAGSFVLSCVRTKLQYPVMRITLRDRSASICLIAATPSHCSNRICLQGMFSRLPGHVVSRAGQQDMTDQTRTQCSQSRALSKLQYSHVLAGKAARVVVVCRVREGVTDNELMDGSVAFCSG